MLSTPEALLTSEEVSTVFRVNLRTVQRWAKTGLIESITTPGGRQKRFRTSDVEALLKSPAQNETEKASTK